MVTAVDVLIQQEVSVHHNVRMRPMLSPDDFLKLNTDGSSRGNPGPSSFGGLIRDSKGRWLCGYMGKMEGGLYTSLEAEMWSIYNGLHLVAEKNLSRLLIETDCETVIGLVVGYYTLRDDQYSLKTVMDVIKKLMMERNCTLVHTRREGNQCADLLAKLGGRQYEEYAVLEKPPAALISYLLQDEANQLMKRRY